MVLGICVSMRASKKHFERRANVTRGKTEFIEPRAYYDLQLQNNISLPEIIYYQ